MAFDYLERHWGLRHRALPVLFELAPFSQDSQAAAAAAFSFARAIGSFLRGVGLRLRSTAPFAVVPRNGMGNPRRNSSALPAVFRLAFICWPAMSISFFCA